MPSINQQTGTSQGTRGGRGLFRLTGWLAVVGTVHRSSLRRRGCCWAAAAGTWALCALKCASAEPTFTDLITILTERRHCLWYWQTGRGLPISAQMWATDTHQWVRHQTSDHQPGVHTRLHVPSCTWLNEKSSDFSAVSLYEVNTFLMS